jgi:hypothetical protein
LCQEFILQWSKRLNELKAFNLNLIMVSIGKPEVGKQLIDHLNIPKGQDYLYVDPESAVYHDLLLNKGIKETFFSFSTPLAFLERFTKKDGMEELTEVLSKWNKGTLVIISVWSIHTCDNRFFLVITIAFLTWSLNKDFF